MNTFRTTLTVAAALAAIIFASARTQAQGCEEAASVCSQGVFCSGFEEGNKNIWDDYDGNPDSTNLLLSDPGPCGVQGNHVMRLRVPPGQGGADVVKVLPGSYDKVFLRWYQKWEPGYNFSAANHGGGLFAGDRNRLGSSGVRPSGADWFSTQFEPTAVSGALNARPILYSYYRGMYQDCANPNGQCWGDSFPCMWDDGQNYCTQAIHRETVFPPQLVSGRWYCIEIMADAGTPTLSATNANGVQNFWIDGVAYGPWTKLWHRTTSTLKLNLFWLALFHHGEHSTAGVMLDNVVASTQPVGCLDSQSTLSAPKNLRIKN